MTVYHGTVKNNVVVLPEGVHLDEGTAVEIVVAVEEFGRVGKPPSEELFRQRLREMGLLEEAKAVIPAPPEEERTPIQVKGKSLSCTIIEERR